MYKTKAIQSAIISGCTLIPAFLEKPCFSLGPSVINSGDCNSTGKPDFNDKNVKTVTGIIKIIPMLIWKRGNCFPVSILSLEA